MFTFIFNNGTVVVFILEKSPLNVVHIDKNIETSQSDNHTNMSFTNITGTGTTSDLLIFTNISASKPSKIIKSSHTSDVNVISLTYIYLFHWTNCHTHIDYQAYKSGDDPSIPRTHHFCQNFVMNIYDFVHNREWTSSLHILLKWEYYMVWLWWWLQ